MVKRSNTASWVDERYAKQLARQAVDTLDADRGNNTAMMTLSTMRKSSLFLREERVRVGPGFKVGTRVWCLDTPVSQARIDRLAPGRRTLEGIKVFAIDYDDKGRVRLGNLKSRPPLANISQHALGRLFERLRTNALDDVVREALIPVSLLAQPMLDAVGEEVEIALLGLGRMPAVVQGACDVVGAPIGAFWQVKTFIALPLT
ncbi:MAG: hypothetical protein KF871_02045 [Hydrogenophaga sp.]|uniref:hypothetical protein n=1 Tax=Hydrogenophaga sp. TaxID=1904254 RepID=UPI001D501F22|nr:hypothetical protein [Hydrogenophaga sp.]MBX3608651.1 hypothetical protein [Hydrogenophaga sp.]